MKKRVIYLSLFLTLLAPALAEALGSYDQRKSDFIKSKYLYHTGQYCSDYYADNLVALFTLDIKDIYDRDMLMAIACIESGYDDSCISTNCKGSSVGLMQIHEHIARIFKKDPKDFLSASLSIPVAYTHFKNQSSSVGAYYLGTNGAKSRPKRAKMYERKAWKVLKQMPWTSKNKAGQPDQHYWKYFNRYDPVKNPRKVIKKKLKK